MIERREFLAALLGAMAAPSLALAEGPTNKVRPKRRGQSGQSIPATNSDDLVALAKLGGTTAFVVVDAATGHVLASREDSVGMPPASVLKSVTSLYAIDRLGHEFRYRTRVLANGPIVDGIIQGDIVLEGAGDPTLQTDQLGDLVRLIGQAGVKGVTGKLLIWDRALPFVPQISADQPVQVGYNPGISGLNLNFNRVHFAWKSQGAGKWGLTMDARGERFLPTVNMAKIQVQQRDTPIFTYDNEGQSELWTVASGALNKEGSRWLPVRHPGKYVGEVFHTLARAQGISLPSPEPMQTRITGQELAAIESEPLDRILKDMLKFSTNLTAEAVGLRSSGMADLKSSGEAMAAWAKQKFGVTAEFVDHSGLGSASRVTAMQMATIFQKGHKAGMGLKPLLRDIGMRDGEGKTIKGHPVQVLAKSGTLNFVSGLAGHITPPTGRELIFAIFSADLARRDQLTGDDRETPPGGKAWLARARALQGHLISLWASEFV